MRAINLHDPEGRGEFGSRMIMYLKPIGRCKQQVAD